MSTWPAPSNLDARTQAFPTLTDAQTSRIRAVGKLRKVQPGEILFEPNDAAVPFFVLLSGTMEIVQPDLTGDLTHERQIVNHGPGEFTRTVVDDLSFVGEIAGEIGLHNLHRSGKQDEKRNRGVIGLK